MPRRSELERLQKVDSAEVRVLAEEGVKVAHNPVSNMKLAVGRAMPYSTMRAQGLEPALATDGAASNNNLDIFEEMKVAALLQKHQTGDPTVLPASEALQMATLWGYRALGFEGGALTPGHPADIIAVDLQGPCSAPGHNLVSDIVYSCSGHSVKHTVVAGQVLMENPQIPGLEEILEGARAAARRLLEGAGRTDSLLTATGHR